MGLIFIIAGSLMLLVTAFLVIKIQKSEDYANAVQGIEAFWIDCENNKLKKIDIILSVLGIIYMILGAILT